MSDGGGGETGAVCPKGGCNAIKFLWSRKKEDGRDFRDEETNLFRKFLCSESTYMTFSKNKQKAFFQNTFGKI